MRSNPAQATEIAALQAQLADQTRLLNGALRFVYRAAPALTPIVGEELGMPVPTTDHQGVIYANTALTVTFVPATETIIIDGNGTPHHLELVAKNGKLSEDQVTKIVATVAAIKAVRGRKADPLLSGLDLLSSPVLADAPPFIGVS